MWGAFISPEFSNHEISQGDANYFGKIFRDHRGALIEAVAVILICLAVLFFLALRLNFPSLLGRWIGERLGKIFG